MSISEPKHFEMAFDENHLIHQSHYIRQMYKCNHYIIRIPNSSKFNNYLFHTIDDLPYGES